MGSTGAQQFCVRWNSYQSNLQNAFPKLLLNENFVDVTLACEAQMIKCHKVVLSACSSYFESLLSQNPCQHPIIFMKDMKYWEVRALVDFMYRGEVNVTQEELTNLLKAAEALQVRGLYGYEQQQRAAAVAQTTDTTTGDIETDVVSTPALPANTTLQSLQDCKAQARSRGSSTHDDSNDQMVKLEEEIMMMEEQSISDSSHLDNDYSALGSSQEFDGFVGDQRYPAPTAVLDADQGAGPSGLTLAPSTNSSPNLHQDKLLAQQHLQQQQQQYQQLQWNQQRWTSTNPTRPPPTKRSKAKTLPRGPNVWETLPKDEMMKQLAIAADLIEQGNSYRQVSNLLHIPKSTIYSYVTKRRAGKGIIAKKENSKSPVKSKIVYPPPVRVKVEINEQRTNYQFTDESQ